MKSALIGMQIIIVESGFCVGQDDKGSDMIVTDTATVHSRTKVWVTKKNYDLLMKHIEEQERT
jgi:hypothetical protein